MLFYLCSKRKAEEVRNESPRSRALFVESENKCVFSSFALALSRFSSIEFFFFRLVCPQARAAFYSTMNCFVYGTLMAEEVLKVLIKRVPEQRPGKANGELARKEKKDHSRLAKKKNTLDRQPRPTRTKKINNNKQKKKTSPDHWLPQARAPEPGLPRDRPGLESRRSRRQGSLGPHGGRDGGLRRLRGRRIL